MCGISGIINLNDSSINDEVNINKMNNRLISRGPDAKNIWYSQNKKIIFGHTRLSIIDPSTISNQPFFDNELNIVITYNGELYNYKELKKKLINFGYNFKTDSDTEVIIKLYHHYQDDMFYEMIGMFSFCLYDVKKNIVLAARDHYGIKPFYYSFCADKFTFSSQVKSIIECDYIPKDKSPIGACSFLINGSVLEPYTMYKNIYALEPGKFIKIKDGNIFKQSYYDLLDNILEIKEDASKYINDEIDLISSLKRTTERHLVSDVPIILFLSSGVDSTSILNSMSNSMSNKINTLTLGFDVYKDTKFDEINLAKQISSNFNTNSKFIYQGKDTFNKHKNNIIYNMDQPSIDGINTYLISNIAKKLGYKVAISGIGGDELFSGYPTFRQVPKMKKIYEYTYFLKNVSNIYYKFSKQFLKKLNLEKLAYFYKFSSSYMGAYTLRRSLFSIDEISNILPIELVKEGLEEFNQSLIDKDKLNSIKDETTKITFLEFDNYLKNQLLKDADWAGMANSIEIRTPFVDKEFINNILKLKMKKNLKKVDLIDTLNPTTRKILLNKRKLGFLIPVADWINSDENTYHSWAKRIISNYNF